jgi:hypothetical protein
MSTAKAITHNTAFSIVNIMYALRMLKISATVLSMQRLARWTAKPIKTASSNETTYKSAVIRSPFFWQSDRFFLLMPRFVLPGGVGKILHELN